WVESGVAVDDGRIVRIAKEPQLPPADESVDAGGLLLLPGAVDTHTHFSYGRPDRTDLGTGSGACASGGVTFFVEQAASTPEHCRPTLDASALQEKVALGERSSLVDFGVHGGGCAENLSRIPDLLAGGVRGSRSTWVGTRSGSTGPPRTPRSSPSRGGSRAREPRWRSTRRIRRSWPTPPKRYGRPGGPPRRCTPIPGRPWRNRRRCPGWRAGGSRGDGHPHRASEQRVDPGRWSGRPGP
ncbi:dihydroorotase, partial [mine drainage metagenome]